MVSRDELREMVRRLERELKEECKARDKKVFAIVMHCLSLTFDFSCSLSSFPSS